MGAALELLNGERAGEAILLPEAGVLVLGSHAQCDAVLRGEGIYPQHAVVEVSGGRHVLHDQTEGKTLRNGERVEQAALEPGDVVCLGRVALRYRGETDGGLPVPAKEHDRLLAERDARIAELEKRVEQLERDLQAREAEVDGLRSLVASMGDEARRTAAAVVTSASGLVDQARQAIEAYVHSVIPAPLLDRLREIARRHEAAAAQAGGAAAAAAAAQGVYDPRLAQEMSDRLARDAETLLRELESRIPPPPAPPGAGRSE